MNRKIYVHEAKCELERMWADKHRTWTNPDGSKVIFVNDIEAFKKSLEK